MTEFVEEPMCYAVTNYNYNTNAGDKRKYTTPIFRCGDICCVDSLIISALSLDIDIDKTLRSIGKSELLLRIGGEQRLTVSLNTIYTLQKISDRKCFIVDRHNPSQSEQQYVASTSGVSNYNNMLIIPLCMDLLLKDVCLRPLTYHEVAVELDFVTPDGIDGLGFYIMYSKVKMDGPYTDEKYLATTFGKRIAAYCPNTFVNGTNTQKSKIPILQNYLTTDESFLSPSQYADDKIYMPPHLSNRFIMITIRKRYDIGDYSNYDMGTLPDIEYIKLYNGDCIKPSEDMCIIDDVSLQKTYVILDDKYELNKDQSLDFIKGHLVYNSDSRTIFDRDPYTSYSDAVYKSNISKIHHIKFGNHAGAYDASIITWLSDKLYYVDGMMADYAYLLSHPL